MGLRALRRIELGPFPNEGARLLWLCVQGRGITLSELARELGTKAGMVNRWAWCDVRPGGDWAGVLEDKLAIPVRAWHQPASCDFSPLYNLAQPAAGAA